MDDLEEHLEDLQAHYDGIKEDIARAIANDEPTDEFYNENFAAVADALGIANFKSHPEKSYELLKEALEIRRDKVCKGNDDESVITSLNNICILLRKMDIGKEDEAIGVFQREAVEMFCRLYPESRHLNAAANLNSLVDIMNEHKIGNVESDVRYLKMAVDRFRKYVAAEAEKRKVQGDEVVDGSSPTTVDPVLIHYIATLRKLADKMSKLTTPPAASSGKNNNNDDDDDDNDKNTTEKEIAEYLTEAKQLEQMFENDENRLLERDVKK